MFLYIYIALCTSLTYPSLHAYFWKGFLTRGKFNWLWDNRIINGNLHLATAPCSQVTAARLHSQYLPPAAPCVNAALLWCSSGHLVPLRWWFTGSHSGGIRIKLKSHQSSIIKQWQWQCASSMCANLRVFWPTVECWEQHNHEHLLASQKFLF